METITGVKLGPKETELMIFLHTHVFDPALCSPTASAAIKTGVRYTIMRMEQRGTAKGMVEYFWSAVHGTERSVRFADLMAEAKLPRFEEALVEFRRHFNDEWLSSTS